MVKIHNPHFTDEEKHWLSLLLSGPIRYKEDILRQIEHAAVKRDYLDNHLFLDFLCPEDVPPLPDPISGVPLTMVVQRSDSISPAESRIVYQRSYDMPYFFGPNRECPTEFLLHFRSGVIEYLELFNGDGSALNCAALCTGRADFSISPELAP